MDTESDRPTGSRPLLFSSEVTNLMIEDTTRIKPSRVADTMITPAKMIKFIMDRDNINTQQTKQTLEHMLQKISVEMKQKHSKSIKRLYELSDINDDSMKL